MRTRTASWNGSDSIVCEAGGTRLVFVPSRGAKIVSLTDSSGEEWLLQPGAPRARSHPAGTAFTEAEMCGWDECAPTIEAAPTGPGVTAPDHGELWDAHWRPTGDGGFSAPLPSIGAELARWVSIADDGSVTLSYRATHLDHDASAVPLLWAAHPMFVQKAGDHLSAGGVETLWDVASEPPAQIASDTTDGSASTVEQVLNAPRAPGTSAKFYADPRERPSWARLRRASGRSLTLTWDSEQIPYLGIWIDRGRFARADVVAFEPSTGWFDSVQRAQLSGHVLSLAPGESAEWSLTARFDN